MYRVTIDDDEFFYLKMNSAYSKALEIVEKNLREYLKLINNDCYNKQSQVSKNCFRVYYKLYDLKEKWDYYISNLESFYLYFWDGGNECFCQYDCYSEISIEELSLLD